MVSGPTESSTCRDFVVPLLEKAGWVPGQIVEQYYLQNPQSEFALRQANGNPRVADYVLEIDSVPVAVLEAKRLYAAASDGIGQAIDYARRLDVPFAFATNGREILLHDRHGGTETEMAEFPTPDIAWSAFQKNRQLTDRGARTLRVGYDRTLRAHGGREVKEPRYYQRVAVQRTVEAMDSGRTRLLLLMATGTGKTFTALQLIHKLRSSAVQLDRGKTFRVLYLADRDILVTDPMREFTEVFGNDAVTRLSKRSASRSRDLYFATYQGLDGDAVGLGDAPDGTALSVFQSLPRDFFSLVIVDECHRGSASAGSQWRGILEHFDAAVQVGLTATPKRDTNIDTYEYFGEPVFEYSLREGIDDGYLAPYRVRRAVLDIDALGWTAGAGQMDVYGRQIPEGHYTTKDFERRLSLPDRTRVMAEYLVNLLREHPGARAVVFCVSAQHAHDMRQAMLNADPDNTRRDPEWVVRIVGSEPDKERYLDAFTDPSLDSPQVATTMQLLSTGVDIEDLRFVVLCRPVGSMVEFKQIVGRGTRLYPPKGKQYFEVIDFTGASAKFQDPTFDGPLPAPRKEHVTEGGESLVEDEGEHPLGGGAHETAELSVSEPQSPFEHEDGGSFESEGGSPPVRMLTVEGEQVQLLGEQLRFIDPEDGTLTTKEYRSYAREKVRTLFPHDEELRRTWVDSNKRVELLRDLEFRGIDVQILARYIDSTDADPFDVLASVAWDLPLWTRKERAERVRVKHGEELEKLTAVAREVISILLDRYAELGVEEITPAALGVPPLTSRGTPVELAQAFGGTTEMRRWLSDLQAWIYEDSR